jgi:hypothetical protein
MQCVSTPPVLLLPVRCTRAQQLKPPLLPCRAESSTLITAVPGHHTRQAQEGQHLPSQRPCSLTQQHQQHQRAQEGHSQAHAQLWLWLWVLQVSILRPQPTDARLNYLNGTV